MKKSMKLLFGCILLGTTLVGCGQTSLVNVNPNYGTDEGLICDANKHWSLVNGQVSNAEAHNFAEGSCSVCGYIESSSANLKFELNDTKDGYVVSSTKKDVRQVTIPNYYNDLPVTAIDNYAFLENSSLVYAGLPTSLTYIGRSAFSGCISLNDVVIPNSVTTIKEQAFSTCKSLTNIKFSSNLKELAWRSFYGCVSLSEITLPEGLTSLGHSAFYGCLELTKVSIPNSIESVGVDVFTRCSKLNYNESDNGIYLGNESSPYILMVDVKDDTVESLSINSDTKIIGPNAVRDLKALKQVNIPNGVVSISGNAFQGCITLEKVILPSTLRSIDEYAFAFNNELKEVAVPNGVTSIGNNAFYSCAKLENVSFPNTLVTFGVDVFAESTNIKYNTFEDGEYLGNDSNERLILVKAIVEEPEESEESEESENEEDVVITYEINSNTKIIGAGAFQRSIITEIEIPSNIISISDSSFFNCSNLENIKFNQGLKYIAKSAFSNCIKVENITLPNGLETIANKAFAYGLALKSINVPNTVKYVGDGAFSSGYAEITIKCQANSQPLGWSDSALPEIKADSTKNPTILWGQN